MEKLLVESKPGANKHSHPPVDSLCSQITAPEEIPTEIKGLKKKKKISGVSSSVYLGKSQSG